MAGTSFPQELLLALQKIADNPPASLLKDDTLRRNLRDVGRDLSLALEAGSDVVHRLGSLPLELAMARIGVETKIFEKLCERNDRAWTSDELAKACGTDPLLMARMMRYFAAFRMVKEVGEDRFKASNISRAMVPEGLKAGINYFFEMISPSYMYFPEFLRKNHYINTVDPSNTPWQLGWKTDKTPFEWLHANPTHMGYFLPWMMAQRFGMPIWLDVFPYENELGTNTTHTTPLFVDIGGAMGHQCVAFKERFSQLPGRVILQDLPQVISNVPSNEGVEAMAYNFWEPQPVQGARAYYLRNILHDWPDEKCRVILENTKSAMTADSVIIIDEMVIPSQNVPWRAAQLDITMMTCLAAQERTQKQFEAVLTSAGLKLVKVLRYTEELGDSILVAVPQ